jgi:hypothetical protein
MNKLIICALLLTLPGCAMFRSVFGAPLDPSEPCSELPGSELMNYAAECSARKHRECDGRADREACRAAIAAECDAHIDALCE